MPDKPNTTTDQIADIPASGRMKVELHAVEPGSDDRQITITYSRPRDDPSGALSVFAASGNLAALAREVGRHAEPDVALDEREFDRIMAMYRELFHMLEPRRRTALLAGRDQFHRSWRDLALHSDVPFATVKRWVLEERARYAGLGMWFAPSGLQHDDDPTRFAAEEARTERDRYDERDNGWTEGGNPVLRDGA